ncbi:MAG: hypothetical protein ACLQVM_09355 [Terriglobia bacterium]
MSSFPAARNEPTAFTPTGSLLLVESVNFALLVRDWENSKEKQKWLASDNYQVFSRSRLFLRLQEAQRQFAVAAPSRIILTVPRAGGNRRFKSRGGHPPRWAFAGQLAAPSAGVIPRHNISTDR